MTASLFYHWRSMLHNTTRLHYVHTIIFTPQGCKHVTCIQAWGSKRKFSWFTRKQIVRLSVGAISTNGRSWKYTLKQLETINDKLCAMCQLWNGCKKRTFSFKFLYESLDCWLFLCFFVWYFTVCEGLIIALSVMTGIIHIIILIIIILIPEKSEKETINVKRHFRIE